MRISTNNCCQNCYPWKFVWLTVYYLLIDFSLSRLIWREWIVWSNFFFAALLFLFGLFLLLFYFLFFGLTLEKNFFLEPNSPAERHMVVWNALTFFHVIMASIPVLPLSILNCFSFLVYAKKMYSPKEKTSKKWQFTYWLQQWFFPHIKF